MSCPYETEYCKNHVHCETCKHWEGFGVITTGVNDSLIITYDNSARCSILTVARKDKFDMTILNKFKGDDALGIYHLLTGGGRIEFDKGIYEVMFQLKCINEHLKFISKTTDKSIDFDIQVLNGCISELEKWVA